MNSQPIYTAGAAVYRKTAELVKHFTWTDRFGVQYPAYREVGKMLHVPREAVPLGHDDFRLDGEEIYLPGCRFKPRNADQVRVVDEALDLLEEGRSFVIQASTGFGKTVICMPLIQEVGRKTLVVVTKSDLVKQWREKLTAFLPGVRVGLIRANTCDVEDKDVVIAMLHSVCKPDRYPATMYAKFGLVIFDEVHRLPATQFSGAAFQFGAKLRLGLSATPKRTDGKDRLITAHVGPVAVVAKVVPMRPKVLRYHTEWKPVGRGGRKIKHSATKNMHVVKMLAKNLRRNRLVAHLIGVCRAKDRNLVVFSHLTEHLLLLADLAAGEGVKRIDMGFYVGELHGKKQTQGQLEQASVKKVVFATYGMLRESTDCPWWDACILSTPAGNAKQPVGRILREHPDKKTPVIIDLVDSYSDVFLNFGYGRDRYYQGDECRAEVIDLDLPEV